MRWVRFAVFILVVTILQADAVDIIAIGDITPDLLLILLVFFAIYGSTTEAIITSFILGLASDLIGHVMGPGIISFGILGTSLAYLHRFIAIRQMLYQVIAIFITGFLAGLLMHFLTFFRGQPATLNICGSILKESIYSCLIGPFFFLPSAWLMNIKAYRFSRH
jgi:rod shape-determining protein MreD